MKSILILTDFSEAAFRAAEYACELTGPLHIERIVLYHAYQTFIAGTDVPVTNIDDQQLYLESMKALGMLQDRLKPLVKHTVTIDLVAEDAMLADLAGLINQRCRKEEIDMIVMGVSGKSEYEQFLIGSTTAEMLRSSELPVLVVPKNTLLGKPMQTIVFTSDLKDIAVIPVRALYDFLDALRGKLYVVNVKPEGAEKYSPEMEKAIAGLHELLGKYDPAFHYIKGDDVVEAIRGFAEQQHASLIIAVHQKHGFWSALFHKSVSKKLAYNSQIPLLSLPGLE